MALSFCRDVDLRASSDKPDKPFMRESAPFYMTLQPITVLDLSMSPTTCLLDRQVACPVLAQSGLTRQRSSLRMQLRPRHSRFGRGSPFI